MLSEVSGGGCLCINCQLRKFFLSIWSRVFSVLRETDCDNSCPVSPVDPDIIDAIGRLVQVLVETLGPTRTIGLVVILVLFLGARRLYLDYRASKAVNQALEEKERSIQRLNTQEREWRQYFLMEKGGMSREEAERLVLRNEFDTPAEARRALENPDGQVGGKEAS